jgi:hypothetical protein
LDPVEALNIPGSVHHTLTTKVFDAIAPWLQDEILHVTLPQRDLPKLLVWKHTKDGKLTTKAAHYHP